MAQEHQKSKDITRTQQSGPLDLIIECLYESDEESDEDEPTTKGVDLTDDCSSSCEDSDSSLAEHLAFLDGVADDEEDGVELPFRTDCHCSVHASTATSKPKCNIKSDRKKLQKLTKKCKKLHRRYSNSHQPLISLELLSELAEQIIEMRMVAQGCYLE